MLVFYVFQNKHDLQHRLMRGIVTDLQPHLCMCFSIVQAYVLLAPDQFLQVHGERVVSSCLALLVDDELKNEGIIMIIKGLELMIRTNPTRGLSLLQPVYKQLFKLVV